MSKDLYWGEVNFHINPVLL